MKRLIDIGFVIETEKRRVKEVEQFCREERETLLFDKALRQELVLAIRTGKVRITEEQVLHLQQMKGILTREQIAFLRTHMLTKNK